MPAFSRQPSSAASAVLKCTFTSVFEDVVHRAASVAMPMHIASAQRSLEALSRTQWVSFAKVRAYAVC